MSIKKRALAAVAGVALTLTIAVAAVAAGGPRGGAAAPAASTVGQPVAAASVASSAPAALNVADFGGVAGQFGALATGMADPARCQDVQTKLAANLGVTTDQLTAAIKKTLIQEIDAREQAGTLTADQAKAARDRVNGATDLCAGLGVRLGDQDKGGGPGAGRGMGMLDGATYQAVATYFGIGTDQLRQDLASAGSLQGVAAKYGKDNAAGKAGLQAAIEQALRADLAKRNLSQQQIDQVIAQFTANFDTLYTAKLGQGFPIGPGGRPGQKPGNPHPSGTPTPTTRTQ